VKEGGIANDPNLDILVPIAQALGDLCQSLVFVGGCATEWRDNSAHYRAAVFGDEA